MKSPLLSPLLLAWWCISGLAAFGATNVVVTTHCYRVRGTNTVEIRESMLERRPWKTNFAYDAKTAWDTKYVFTCRPAGKQWVLASADVKTQVTVTLPQWIPGVPVTRELVALWTQYLQGLGRHELGHVQLAREATVQVQRRLEALPPFDSVAALTAAAKRAAQQAVEAARKQEQEYDERTHHGMTQGAVFHLRPATGGG